MQPEKREPVEPLRSEVTRVFVIFFIVLQAFQFSYSAVGVWAQVGVDSVLGKADFLCASHRCGCYSAEQCARACCCRQKLQIQIQDSFCGSQPLVVEPILATSDTVMKSSCNGESESGIHLGLDFVKLILSCDSHDCQKESFVFWIQDFERSHGLVDKIFKVPLV